MLWFDVEDLRRWIDVTWERINSLRPPPSVDFSWKSTWPIPLYGLACVAHRRLRASRPRRLLTLTTITLPEIYGVFALGHVAHLEANRLHRKAAEDGHLEIIQELATWAGREYRRHPERFTTPTGRGFKEGMDYTLLLFQKPMDAFQLWKYKFRCSWASEQSREAATCLLARRLAIATPSPIPYHDTGLVTLYVSEELDGSCILRPSFLRDKPLMLEYASFALLSTISRWAGASAGVLRTNMLLERCFIYVLAFKWLGGRYCHCASIFGFEKTFFVVRQISLSRIDWEIKHGEWVAEADPGATFAELGLPAPPWFGDV